ncbi:MAG: associated Golgi protein [Thermoleophilia bacterium]|nr:associated Golgi protein [Thermoleophilia bacterium]
MTIDRNSSPHPNPVPEGEGTDAGETIRDTLRRLGPAAPLAIAVTVLPPIGSLILIAVATTTQLAPWMRANPSVAMPLYIVAFWALGICCLPTYAYSVLGAYAFGFWGGTFTALAAYVGACAFAFAIARALARDRVVPLVERYPKLAAVRHVLADASFARSLFVIALLRISPASPFAITNVVLGASGVRWPAFAFGTFIGVVPRTVAVVWITSRAGSLSFDAGEGWWLFAIGAIATVVAVAVIARLARNELDRMTKRHVFGDGRTG